MRVTKTSSMTGITRTFDLPITHEQIECYESGELLQVAFPNLTRAQREFLKTGIVQEEWDELEVK